MQGTVWPLSPARETKEKGKMIVQQIQYTYNNALLYLSKLTLKQQQQQKHFNTSFKLNPAVFKSNIFKLNIM